MTTVKMLPVEEQMRVIMRGVEYGDPNVRRTMETELAQRLASGKPLRVYLGVDPTFTDLHLGHSVPLRKLRQFQDLGHHAILVIGDFTALIGDPSDKESERPMLSEDEVAAFSRSYLEQAGRVLDLSRLEVRRNADWLSKLSFRDLIPMASLFTVAQFLNRETFAKRYQRGDPIHLHEFFYALMQGYDAVALEADVQLGGVDQLFNIMAGRDLQRYFGQQPQVAVLLPILLGTDGRLKMSKSLGNHIPISTTPQDMYGKVMSIPDTLIMPYFELLTDLPAEELAEIGNTLAARSVNPMEVKMQLAREIVGQFHGAEAAKAAEEEFARVFRERKMPKEALEVRISFKEAASAVPRIVIGPPDAGQQKGPPYLLATLLAEAGVVPSMMEGRRLIEQGAVKIDGEKFTRSIVNLKDGMVIRVGKHRFLRIVDADKG